MAKKIKIPVKSKDLDLEKALDEAKKKFVESIGSPLWPGEDDAIRKALYEHSLEPILDLSKRTFKGIDVSGEFVDEIGTLTPDDLDRMAKYWKSREKDIGGGWLIGPEEREDLLARAKRGEDIRKYFSIPRDEISEPIEVSGGYTLPPELADELMSGKSIYGKPITIKEFSKEFYGRSAIAIDDEEEPISYEYQNGFIGINPESPDLKFRLDRLISNSEWIGYHYLAGNWDMWAGYLGDGYWVTSIKLFNPELFMRPWCLVFWRDHDDVFTWLHSEFLDGSVVIADDPDSSAFYEDHFAIIRRIESWAQTFARRMADGELSTEWSGHDD